MSFGEPEDVEGKCNARLFLADNFGDNHTTIRCSMEAGHEGLHRERFPSETAGIVEITWEDDERNTVADPNNDFMEDDVLGEDDEDLQD